MMSWNELFALANASGAMSEVEMRVLKKHGRPLLLVPKMQQLAARCLDLYPAQTSRARLAKAALRNLWRLGMLIKTEPAKLLISDADPFKNYLGTVAGSGGKVPSFGILAGNPAGGTQRFIILLFDDEGTPRAAVKAGSTQAARELVRKEEEFLSSVPAAVKGIPGVISKFHSESVDAFASDFISGESSFLSDQSGLEAVLTSWLNPERKMALGDFPELSAAIKGREGIANRQIVTAIQHGDFAPWNIKVSMNGQWTVLDWERGRLAGIPAWDWFHYLIQTNILVRRAPEEQILKEAEELFSSARFRAYAEKAQITKIEWLLLYAYLLYVVEVIKPAEGFEANRALLQAVTCRMSDSFL
jgi:hypothetical protein